MLEALAVLSFRVHITDPLPMRPVYDNRAVGTIPSYHNGHIKPVINQQNIATFQPLWQLFARD